MSASPPDPPTPRAADLADLRAAAEAVCRPLELPRDCSAATVGAAIRTAAGDVFTGVNLDMACGIGFCAEHSAVAEMLKARQTVVTGVVAIGRRGVLPPCGRCRELLVQVDPLNARAAVLVGPSEAVRLGDLLPRHWYPSEAGAEARSAGDAPAG